jgi:hypothetical protein
MAVQLPNGRNYFATATGGPGVGYRLYTYIPGTSTPKATYTTSAGSSGPSNTNPVVADARGEMQIYWDGSYDVVLRDSSDAVIWGPERLEDSAGNLEDDLADAASSSLGAGMVGFADTVSYVSGSIGFALLQLIDRAKINLLDYVVNQTVAGRESVRTGATACDAAFAAALTASYLRNNATIHVPHGAYRVDGLITIAQGVMISCEGSQGSTEAYGTSFKHFSNGSCFRWDGTGTDFLGTGGGLLNALIIKDAAYSGGNAIEIIATSDNKRPGEMFFQNVLAYGTGAGRWTRGCVIDGSAANTAGSRGVRTVVMHKCRFADVTTAGETVQLKQVTSFYSNGLATDTGSGSTAGVKIEGISDGVYMTNSAIGGTFTVVANDASNTLNNFHLSGKVSTTFSNNDTQVDGTIRISTSAAGVLTNRSKALKCIANNTASFTLRNAVTDTNVTGDNTLANVAFDTDVFDQGNNFGSMPATDFNCFCAGDHVFSGAVLMSSLKTAHTRANLYIEQTGSVTRSHIIVENPANSFAGASGSGLKSIQFTSPVLSLAYGDVVRVRLSVNNDTKTVGIFGDANDLYTWFSGKYLP